VKEPAARATDGGFPGITYTFAKLASRDETSAATRLVNGQPPAASSVRRGPMVAGRSRFFSAKCRDSGKRSVDFTVLQGNSAIEVMLVSNETRHFLVCRHAPIRREMIDKSRQVVT
jgi:hypothetical protein